jgi:hypothetical protein
MAIEQVSKNDVVDAGDLRRTEEQREIQILGGREGTKVRDFGSVIYTDAQNCRKGGAWRVFAKRGELLS